MIFTIMHFSILHVIGATFKCYYIYHSHLRLSLHDFISNIADISASWLRLIVYMFWLVKVFMSEKSCQRDHVRSWQRNHVREIMTEESYVRGIMSEIDHTCITSLQATGHTKDKYVSWLMGYLGMMSGILLNLASFSTYPFFVLTHTRLFWLWSLCLRSPSRFIKTGYVLNNPVHLRLWLLCFK